MFEYVGFSVSLPLAVWLLLAYIGLVILAFVGVGVGTTIQIVAQETLLWKRRQEYLRRFQAPEQSKPLPVKDELIGEEVK